MLGPSFTTLKCTGHIRGVFVAVYDPSMSPYLGDRHEGLRHNSGSGYANAFGLCKMELHVCIDYDKPNQVYGCPVLL